MNKYIFCVTMTSFRYEGRGKYQMKFICPKCQSENFKTNFNSRCCKENSTCSTKALDTN